MVNLLNNAVDAITTDGKIILEFGEDSFGRPYVSVADDAGGIPAEYQKMIFEPRFTTKTAELGTGLGVITSYSIHYTKLYELELQPVLLRVLEEKRVTRIGGHQSTPVDFRIISATHRPLYDDILNKKFRQDLYYRLAVVSLEIPPLRERADDILLIADNLVKEICSYNFV